MSQESSTETTNILYIFDAEGAMNNRKYDTIYEQEIVDDYDPFEEAFRDNEFKVPEKAKFVKKPIRGSNKTHLFDALTSGKNATTVHRQRHGVAEINNGKRAGIAPDYDNAEGEGDEQ